METPLPDKRPRQPRTPTAPQGEERAYDTAPRDKPQGEGRAYDTAHMAEAGRGTTHATPRPKTEGEGTSIRWKKSSCGRGVRENGRGVTLPAFLFTGLKILPGNLTARRSAGSVLVNKNDASQAKGMRAAVMRGSDLPWKIVSPCACSVAAP